LRKKGLSKVAIAIIIAVVIIVAGIGAFFLYPKESAEKITLAMMSGWTHEPSIPPQKELIAEYEKLHPEIEIDWRFVEHANQVNALAADLAAGTPPDMIASYISPFSIFYKQGHLRPVDDIVEAIGGKNFFYEGLLKAFTWDDHIWAVPDHTSTLSVNYRKDLFEKFNVSIPKTWDEFLEAAKTLTRDLDGDGKIDVYGVGFPLGRNYIAGDLFLSFLWLNGANIVNATGDIVIDTPEAIEAFEFIKNLCQYAPPDISAWGFSQMKEVYYTGRVAMNIYPGLACLDLTYANAPEIAKNTGTFIPPFGPHGSSEKVGDRYLRGATSGVAVTKYTKHYDEVKEFLVWFFKPENWFKVMASEPVYLSPVSPIMAKYQPYLELQEVKDCKEALTYYTEKVLPHTREPVLAADVFNPEVPGLIQGLYLTDMLQEIIIGNASVKDAVAKWKPLMQAYVEK
jgi:multiple sugar transport system substrate-binding protein